MYVYGSYDWYFSIWQSSMPLEFHWQLSNWVRLMNIIIEQIEDSWDFCDQISQLFWIVGETCHCTYYSKIFVWLSKQSMLERKSMNITLLVQMLLSPYQELQVYQLVDCASLICLGLWINNIMEVRIHRKENLEWM